MFCKNFLHNIAKHNYGESLDNTDHGKNLIHKLMLENRILIEEIKK